MKKKFFLVFLLVCMLLLIPVDNVLADVSDLLLTRFDSVASGLDSGTDGYITFTNVGTANFFETSTTSALTSPNSFKVKSTSEGYWNLTSDFPYIGVINISFVFTDGGISYNYMNFTDSDDNVVISIRWLISNAGNDDIECYDVSTGWADIEGNIVASTRYYLVITHNGTNQFNYSILNSGFAYVDGVERAGAYAGDYTNFSYIHFEGGTAENFVYLDNFYINTDDSSSFDFSDYDYICSNSLTSYSMVGGNSPYVEHEFEYAMDAVVYGVLLPISTEQYGVISSLTVNYECILNGFYCGHPDDIVPYADGYALIWSDLNDGDGVILDNEKPLLAFRCDYGVTFGSTIYYWYGIGSTSSGIGRSRYHNVYGSFANDLLDGHVLGTYVSCCIFYNESDYADVPDWILDSYIDLFGNEFIQFYRFNLPCFHVVGDNPYIIYNLSDDNFTDGDYKNPYILRIYKVDDDNSLFYQTYISFVSDYRSAYYRLAGVEFSVRGDYQIFLYNSSDNGSTLGSLLLKSEIITVCYEGYDPDDDIVDDVDDELTYYEWMAGFGLVLGFGCAPIFLFKDNNFAQRNGLYIMLLFALIGLYIANHFELLPFYIVYIIGIICVVFLSLSIYHAISRS